MNPFCLQASAHWPGVLLLLLYTAPVPRARALGESIKHPSWYIVMPEGRAVDTLVVEAAEDIVLVAAELVDAVGLFVWAAERVLEAA